MVNVNLKIQKKDLFLIAAIFVFMVGAGIIIAFGGNNPQVMGHSLSEITMPSCFTGQYLQKTSSEWSCGSVTSPQLYYTSVLSSQICTGGWEYPEAYCPSGYTRIACGGFFNHVCWGDSACDYDGSYPYNGGCKGVGYGVSGGCAQAIAYCIRLG
jgi:hypothetical protein